MGWIRYFRVLFGYILPLEVVTAVFVVFSLEHVVEWVVISYFPWMPGPTPWLVLAAGITVISALIGSTDDEFEDELDSKTNEHDD